MTAIRQAMWRNAKQPRLRFRRWCPLPFGWELEMIYSTGRMVDDPKVYAYKRSECDSLCERGWVVAVPFTGRSIALGHGCDRRTG